MEGPSAQSSLLSVEEVADRLTISIRSVRNLIRDGRLPIVRVTSRRVAIAESDLQSFVDARRSDREGATT